MSAAMRATLAGSAGSSRMSRWLALALGTAQKPQPRVHQLPRIMNVAAPRWKHSWMLGQRADSHTVCRLSCRNPLFSRLSDSKWVRPLRAHSGSRGRAPPICISGACGSVTRFFSPGGILPLPVASWPSPWLSYRCRAPPARASGSWFPDPCAPGSPDPSTCALRLRHPLAAAPSLASRNRQAHRESDSPPPPPEAAALERWPRAHAPAASPFGEALPREPWLESRPESLPRHPRVAQWQAPAAAAPEPERPVGDANPRREARWRHPAAASPSAARSAPECTPSLLPRRTAEPQSRSRSAIGGCPLPVRIRRFRCFSWLTDFPRLAPCPPDRARGLALQVYLAAGGIRWSYSSPPQSPPASADAATGWPPAAFGSPPPPWPASPTRCIRPRHG